MSGEIQWELALPKSLFRVSLLDKMQLSVVHQLDGTMNRLEGGYLTCEGARNHSVRSKMQLWQWEGSRTEVVYMRNAIQHSWKPRIKGRIFVWLSVMFFGYLRPIHLHERHQLPQVLHSH